MVPLPCAVCMSCSRPSWQPVGTNCDRCNKGACLDCLLEYDKQPSVLCAYVICSPWRSARTATCTPSTGMRRSSPSAARNAGGRRAAGAFTCTERRRESCSSVSIARRLCGRSGSRDRRYCWSSSRNTLGIVLRRAGASSRSMGGA